MLINTIYVSLIRSSRRTGSLSSVFLLVFAAAIVLASCDSSGPATFGDPAEAPILTSDIDRFWAAYDTSTPSNRAKVFQSEYLDKGSSGLDAFVDLRIDSAEKLAASVRAYEQYYLSTRPEMSRIAELEPEIRASFAALDTLYANATFPPVYFLVGRMSTGGTISDEGILIGTEMFSRPADAPLDELTEWHRAITGPVEDLPHIVAHELIHMQQRYGGETTLLHQSILEGSADFLGEMISGRTVNQQVYDWADPREAELWAEFQQEMNGTLLENWLYQGNTDTDRPADLGYWMGYQIVEAYYQNAENKRQAVYDMLTVQDAQAFLEASGYAPPNP